MDDRYKVVRHGFWWRIRIGNGQQLVGKCWTEIEAMRLAAALTAAFEDGKYVGEQIAKQSNAGGNAT